MHTNACEGCGAKITLAQREWGQLVGCPVCGGGLVATDEAPPPEGALWWCASCGAGVPFGRRQCSECFASVIEQQEGIPTASRIWQELTALAAVWALTSVASCAIGGWLLFGNAVPLAFVLGVFLLAASALLLASAVTLPSIGVTAAHLGLAALVFIALCLVLAMAALPNVIPWSLAAALLSVGFCVVLHLPGTIARIRLWSRLNRAGLAPRDAVH